MMALTYRGGTKARTSTYSVQAITRLGFLLVFAILCFFLSSLDKAVNVQFEQENNELYYPFPNNNRVSPQRAQRVTGANRTHSPLPDFYHEYFQWHAEQMNELKEDPTQWESKKYLIMECYANMHGRQYLKCGGLSDRLRSLPMLLWLAHQSKRILFIAWTKPKMLEAFLEPSSIMDWRIPKELTHLRDRNGLFLHSVARAIHYSNMPDRILRVHLEKPGEELLYTHTKLRYDDICPHIWKAMFHPVPRLQSKLDVQLSANDLTPGSYVATHLRLRYGHTPILEEVTRETTLALACASQLQPGAPILLVTDFDGAKQAARNISRLFSGELRIVTLEENSFLHIDVDQKWYMRKAEEYDATFLDMYLMGQAKCVSHGVGGYGLFGRRMTKGAATCGQFRRPGNTSCVWTFANGTTLAIAE
jgi:hypothetical protein